MSYTTTCWFCGNLHAGILVVGNGSALISQRLRSRQTNGVDIIVLRELDLWLPRPCESLPYTPEDWPSFFRLWMDGGTFCHDGLNGYLLHGCSRILPKKAKEGWVGFCFCKDPGSGCHWRVRLKSTQLVGRYPALCESTKTTSLFENPGQ